MDAKTLEAWRAMAEASTPDLTHERGQPSGCYWLSDDDWTYGQTESDRFDRETDEANAKFWAASRGIVLALIAEVERLQADAEYRDDSAIEAAEAAEMLADERQAAMDDEEKERR